MSLSEEMRQEKRFNRAMRGYASSDVDSYLEKYIFLLEELEKKNADQERALADSESEKEKLLGELNELKEKNAALQAIADEAEQIRFRRDAIINDAQTAADRERADAAAFADGKRAETAAEAERIRTEAESFARQLLIEAQNKKKLTEEETAKLILATKRNCVRRLDTCETSVKEARREYEALCEKIGNMRRAVEQSYERFLGEICVPADFSASVLSEKPEDTEKMPEKTECGIPATAIPETADTVPAEETDPAEEKTIKTEEEPTVIEDAPIPTEKTQDGQAEETVDDTPDKDVPVVLFDQENLQKTEEPDADAKPESWMYIFDDLPLGDEHGFKKGNDCAPDEIKEKALDGITVRHEESGQVAFDKNRYDSILATLDNITAGDNEEKKQINDKRRKRFGFID